MNNIRYILFFSLILFPFTSTSYGLTNSWCSNGKYSKAISPFPKPQFNKCPGYAKKIMTTKEVENYYLNGLGKDYLCKITTHPLFFSSDHKREDYKALKQLFKSKQVNVGLMCAQLNKTKLAEKKVEKTKQKTLLTGSTISYANSKLMSENFEDKNDLKVSDYDRNWIIEKLDNGNSVYCNQIINRWTGFNFGEKNWHNYSISYRIKFEKQKVGELHTHIRKNRNRQGEYRSHHKKSGNIDLVYVKGADRIRDRIVNGSETRIGDNWANIKLIASGNNIAYFVNGKIVASTKDDRLKK